MISKASKAERLTENKKTNKQRTTKKLLIKKIDKSNKETDTIVPKGKARTSVRSGEQEKSSVKTTINQTRRKQLRPSAKLQTKQNKFQGHQTGDFSY